MPNRVGKSNELQATVSRRSNSSRMYLTRCLRTFLLAEGGEFEGSSHLSALLPLHLHPRIHSSFTVKVFVAELEGVPVTQALVCDILKLCCVSSLLRHLRILKTKSFGKDGKAITTNS